VSDKNAKGKSKYESPILIPLGEMAKGTGTGGGLCSVGGNPAAPGNYCSAGPVTVSAGVPGYCEAGNAASPGYCTAGTTAATACTEGTTASSAACSDGTSAGAACTTGSVPH
jgi:hypothetical protein